MANPQVRVDNIIHDTLAREAAKAGVSPSELLNQILDAHFFSKPEPKANQMFKLSEVITKRDKRWNKLTYERDYQCYDKSSFYNREHRICYKVTEHDCNSPYLILAVDVEPTFDEYDEFTAISQRKHTFTKRQPMD